MLNTPVALIIFNRPDLTAQVFNAIRSAQPTTLFVIADGPRNKEEAVLTNATRLVTENIDWPCEVYRHYSDINLGCKMRPYSGITWAFEHTETLIILEDDCLPGNDFFSFCEQLLSHYKSDTNVMHISGNCFLPFSLRDTFYFTHYTHVWGWATWRRAWLEMDIEMKAWPTLQQTNFLQKILKNKGAVNYWKACFDSVAHGDPKIWDYQWTYSVWKNNGIAIAPAINLVSNIGFRNDGTHTQNETNRLANIPFNKTGTIKYPEKIAINDMAEKWIEEHVYGTKKKTRISGFIHKLFH